MRAMRYQMMRNFAYMFPLGSRVHNHIEMGRVKSVGCEPLSRMK